MKLHFLEMPKQICPNSRQTLPKIPKIQMQAKSCPKYYKILLHIITFTGITIDRTEPKKCFPAYDVIKGVCRIFFRGGNSYQKFFLKPLLQIIRKQKLKKLTRQKLKPSVALSTVYILNFCIF